MEKLKFLVLEIIPCQFEKQMKLQGKNLMMEAMQCGLNWYMMIQKREIFRECFEEFDYIKK